MSPTIDSIQRAVCSLCWVPMREMTSHRRERRSAHARQMAMYLARELTPHSLPNIGRHFGGRDHTTVMHGIRAVEHRINSDASTRCAIAGLKSLLEGAQ